jgi:hypothetical protein
MRETYHFVVIEQSDKSVVTELIGYFIIKNCSNTQLFLADASIKSKREIITNRIAGAIIPAGTTNQVMISIIFRGSPNRTKSFKTKLYIADSDGNKQTIMVNYKSIEQPKALKQISEIEIPSSIPDPVEKEIASVLQLEMCFYKKHGRRAGKLGSIYINIDGRILPTNVVNVFHSNSHKNQSIGSNSENARVNSENLDALLIYYNDLVTRNEKERFIQFLIDRIDPEKGYLSVSYFIVYVLFKLGHLREALNKAKSALPQDETQTYGFSNILFLLNVLLYYRHQDFSTEILDYTEQFISGLSEHSFSILEQIKAIRVLRLLELESKPLNNTT